MPEKFWREESKSERRLKKLKMILRKSARMQKEMDVKLKDAKDYVQSSVQQVFMYV